MATAMVEQQEQKRFYIVGHDIDNEMLRVLTPGDKVMAEINGFRIFSTSSVPSIASDHAWEVVENIPDHKIILDNPMSSDMLELDYADIVTTAKGQPAVFIQDDSKLTTTGPAYIILQMISCGMTSDALSEEVEPFDQIEMLDWLDDDRIKVGMLEHWCQVIQHFNTQGWNYKSIKRFGLRCNVSRDIVKAFQEHNWAVLLDLSNDCITKIGAELHVLPHLLRFAGDLIQHDSMQTAKK